MLKSFITLVASLFALEARAAELPQYGDAQVSIDYVVTAIAQAGPTHKGDPTRLSVEFAGVSHSDPDGRLFDKLGVRCVGVSELAGDRGDCVATDADGDKLLFAYSFPASNGKAGCIAAIFAGGTGKFAGLTGSAEGESAAVRSGPGLPLFVTRQKVSWRLPTNRSGLPAGLADEDAEAK